MQVHRRDRLTDSSIRFQPESTTLRMREDFRAVLGDHQGVLELGAATAVSGEHCPVVVPHVPAADRPG